jgi:protein-tyrosine phosphatase
VKFFHIDDNVMQGGMPIPAFPAGTQACLSLCRVANSRLNHHLVMPIDDNASPGLEWLDCAVKHLKVMDDAGLATYVHCQRGESRSVMVCAAFIMRKYGLCADDAVRWMSEKNPKADMCSEFYYLLREYQESLNYHEIDLARQMTGM